MLGPLTCNLPLIPPHRPPWNLWPAIHCYCVAPIATTCRQLGASITALMSEECWRGKHPIVGWPFVTGQSCSGIMLGI